MRRGDCLWKAATTDNCRIQLAARSQAYDFRSIETRCISEGKRGPVVDKTMSNRRKWMAIHKNFAGEISLDKR